MHHFLLLLPLAGTPTPTLHVAPSDAIDELIAEGRSKLDQGDPQGALEFFNQADAETHGELRTRMWVLRAHFEEGRQIMDAFDEVDRLSQENDSPDLDYLYGMGSYFKAKKYIAEGVKDNSVKFAYADAQSFLTKATRADARRYYDAWYPLADAAWMNQDLKTAGQAIEQAVEVRPKDPAVRFLQGRILFSQYTATKARDEKGAAAKLDASVSALRQAAELVTDPKRQATLLASIQRELGIALQWQGDVEGAQEAYAISMGWDPTLSNYQSLWTSLQLEPFIATLEKAEKLYAEHYGSKNPGDATMLWWLGSAYSSAGKYEESERTFLTVLDKWPAYTNSWFYIALSRYYREDYDGAIEAWHENWKASRSDLVNSINANAELNLKILSFVIGKCAEKGQGPRGQGEYNVKADFLCEVRCAAAPDNWKFWNDWGLFARDGGAFLAERNSKPEDRKTAFELYETSWKAYNEAIRLAPDKPHLYNDAAVVLHYYLERDYDQARELYEKAYAMAEKLLADGNLSDEDRALAETARRDSKSNLAELEKKLEGDGDGGGDGGER